MAKVIGVLSGKGGVGKTTVVANLGAALTNKFGKNVVILDSNLKTSHLGLHLGIYEDLPVTLKDVINKRMPITSAVYVHPSTGIRIIPAPLSGDGVNLTRGKLIKATKNLQKNYEIVIVDCPPGLGRDAITSISATDSALVVTTPDFPAIADAMKTVQLLEKLKKKIIGVVVNRSRNEKYELTTKEIASTCGVDVISVVPEDKRILEAVSRGVPIVISFPFSPASKEIQKLAGLLVGERYEGENFWNRLKNIFTLRRAEISKPQQIIIPEAQEEKKEIKKKLRKEKKDVEQLGGELKEELKQEIMERVRRKLREKI